MTYLVASLAATLCLPTSGTSADRVLRRLTAAVAGLPTSPPLPASAEVPKDVPADDDSFPDEFYKLTSDGAHDFVYELVGRDGLDELPHGFSFLLPGSHESADDPADDEDTLGFSLLLPGSHESADDPVDDEDSFGERRRLMGVPSDEELTRIYLGHTPQAFRGYRSSRGVRVVFDTEDGPHDGSGAAVISHVAELDARSRAVWAHRGIVCAGRNQRGCNYSFDTRFRIFCIYVGDDGWRFDLYINRKKERNNLWLKNEARCFTF